MVLHWNLRPKRRGTISSGPHFTTPDGVWIATVPPARAP
eukprot:CAMPEP_0179220420 /NCGR_PEP_ID=MMETSP0797-20121207/5609_1 /TAXON_ID=47934 /ORGANISM="Dinophysis acuminata, Strain DAEP01" /LENGTH=38 /DNA_ID= /DNA_START= /DNA_END= /DNA_ORIENTATION=